MVGLTVFPQADTEEPFGQNVLCCIDVPVEMRVALRTRSGPHLQKKAIRNMSALTALLAAGIEPVDTHKCSSIPPTHKCVGFLGRFL